MLDETRTPAPDQKNIAAIDSAFAIGGLTRTGRLSKRGPRRKELTEASVAELRRKPPVSRVAANGVRWLSINGWSLPWLWSGFSTRQGGLSHAFSVEGAPGELNLGFTTADDRSIVEANRRLLVEAVTGSPATPLVVVRQFHSNLIIRVSMKDIGGEPRKADGVITNQPGFLLAVQVADCIPVLVADKKKRVVAAFHAGWRGTVKRIVESGVGRMRLEFGCKPQDLVAAIGPGIGQCCYAVGEDVISEFRSQFAYADGLFREVYDADPVRQKYPMLFLTQRAPGHSEIGPQTHLDLAEANRRQLLDAGLKPKSIEAIGGCTNCDRDLFYSHRGSQGHAGRMMGVIGIRD